MWRRRGCTQAPVIIQKLDLYLNTGFDAGGYGDGGAVGDGARRRQILIAIDFTRSDLDVMYPHAQGLTLEDVATAGLYAMAHSGGGGAPRGHSPPDPRDISECEGLLEVRDALMTR